MLRLSSTHDGHVREAEIPHEPTDLGASTDCGICLPFPGVSRHHARVEPTKDGVRLIDLGSKNGLKQKGRRLAEVTLRPGESVHLGRARLTLEEIDTSDAILGAPSLSRSAPPVVHETGDGDTDTIASDGLDSTPGEALRLIREIEISGVTLNSPRGGELLDRAARVLGATSLFTVTSSKQGAALRRLNGATPSEEHLRIAAEMAGHAADDEVVSRGVGDGVSMIVHPLGSASAGLVLVALLAATPARLKPWRRDLFGYVAQRLQPDPVRKPAVARPHASAALSLPEGFVRGRSHAMTELLDQLQAAIRSDLDVLILGETGVGKEYVAKIIHASGRSSKGPFVAINCAAIPSEMLEAELFGVKARVATGVDARVGLLTRAQGGCVFLDEIGDMPFPLQAKLLRALQEREVLPVGAHHPEAIHVQVLSSTNKNLTHLVRSSHFRSDLYYRLRGLEFVIPPLRERVADIAVLALAFADRAAMSHEKEIAGISRRALDLLEAHDWPGNVRELRSEIERAVLLCPDGGTVSSRYFDSLRRGDRIEGVHAEREIVPAPTPAPPVARVASHVAELEATTLAERVDAVEAAAITEALVATHGNRTAAAQRLGITRNGLALKMKRLGLGNEE